MAARKTSSDKAEEAATITAEGTQPAEDADETAEASSAEPDETEDEAEPESEDDGDGDDLIADESAIDEDADAPVEAVSVRQDRPVWPKFQRMTDAELEGEIRGWSIPRLPDNHGLNRHQLEQFIMALNAQALIDARKLPSWEEFADSED
jgi:hypothetical protein